jgi:hypothetical protein
MVPDGVYIRTPRGWALNREIEDEDHVDAAADADPPQHRHIDRLWKRNATAWTRNVQPDIYLSIGGPGSKECKSYRTAGDILQSLVLSSSVDIQERFVYIIRLIGFLFPRLICHRGQIATGSTQKVLFETLVRACSLSVTGEYMSVLRETMEVVASCTRQCLEGNVAYRERMLSRCLSTVALPTVAPSSVPLENLPEDVLKMIASFLVDPNDLVHFASSCKAAYLSCSDPVLWRTLCLLYFPQDFVCLIVVV